MEPERETIEKRPAELGLWDAVSVIVGIVVGVSIFKAPPTVFANVGSPWAGVAVWGLGGLVALAGALCYAELASTYPGSGGDYCISRGRSGRWSDFCSPGRGWP